MLQGFVKKKFTDYSALVGFSGSSVFYKQIKQSNLPAFIVHFFDCSIKDTSKVVTRKEFDELLEKAITFNINYIIKPKNTILKFVFGDVETKPAEFIRSRLAYFQFYGYYINHIEDFMTLNSLDVVSVSQVEHIIDDINSKLHDEINDVENGDSQRLNLVKLLYYFFVDLSENNPINIKLPKKILSVFLADKGFYDTKAHVDAFFSDEVFIQEAVDLLRPAVKKQNKKADSDVGMSEKEVRELIHKAKSNLISKDDSNKDVAAALTIKEKVPEIDKLPDVKTLRQAETKIPEVEFKSLAIDEEIYSNDLLFASQFTEIVPRPEPTDAEKKDKITDELFREQSYKKKIIKKLFRKNEASFKQFVYKVIDAASWNDAIPELDRFFKSNKVDLYSEEAVKFVDILQGHFTKSTVYSGQKQQGT